MQARVRPLAQVLADGGVGKGDRLVYVGVNDPANLESLFAAATLGAVLVPLNFRLAGPELAYAITHCGAHTVLADERHTAVIDGVRGELLAHRYVRVTSGRSLPGWEDGEELIAAASSPGYRWTPTIRR